MHYREFPYVQGNPHHNPGISYQLLYTDQYFFNILAFYLTFKHKNITDGFIFIYELLPQKPRVWLSQ